MNEKAVEVGTKQDVVVVMGLTLVISKHDGLGKAHL